MRRIAPCVVFLAFLGGVASAQPRQDRPVPAPAPKQKPPKEQNIVIKGLPIEGKVRGLGLLYFLERANEELERASLEHRSFIPHMMRSVEEEAL